MTLADQLDRQDFSNDIRLHPESASDPTYTSTALQGISYVLGSITVLANLDIFYAVSHAHALRENSTDRSYGKRTGRSSIMNFIMADLAADAIDLKEAAASVDLDPLAPATASIDLVMER